MAEQNDSDPLVDAGSRWLVGMLVLVGLFAVGGVTGATFEELGVPFGGFLGIILGSGVTFLAISYWYYGRHELQ